MPAGALAGLCPACLLAQGAETKTGETQAAHPFEPPSAGEVAKLFPQLEILKLLGAGGMGAVYKARQPALDRLVALKILPPTSARGGGFAERFNREARALARLSHPNIVAVHEFGQAGGLPYFVMEFVDGTNLRQLELAGRLSPREALRIIPQICEALQYAHDAGVVHRDIKPENVLLDRQGRVKIADFGLAKIAGTDPQSLRLTAEGQVMGTPHYMAPEQLEKPLTVDHRADIYSLGVVFYEMLTGDLPLGNFAPPSRKVRVDVRLDEVVLRALENDPERRYQKASEVRTKVESIATAPPEVPERAGEETSHWAGFALAVEREGSRRIHWKGVLHAAAIAFALFTIVFGAVSLSLGGSLGGWLSVKGWPGVLVRLALTALVVSWGVWRALGRTLPAKVPVPPQGTVVLTPEAISRKAVVGACWAPWFFLASFLLFFPVLSDTVRSDIPAGGVGMKWWQILLSLTLLPLGGAAPFGTTILGWLAVGDIRRSSGRLSGLGLALFDGFLFPLLALDVFLYLALINGFYWFTAQVASETFVNPPRVLVSLGACALCGLVDFILVQRVWKALRPGGGGNGTARLWWWNTKPGGIALALLCVLVLGLTAARRQPPDLFKVPPEQFAVQNPETGALVAHLPTRGTLELLAIAEAGAAPDEWWRPDGTPLRSTRFNIESPGGISMMGGVQKDFLFRFSDLPDGADLPVIQCNPGSPYVSGSGIYRNGQPLDHGWAARMAWPKSVRTVAMRLGVGVAPWRTVTTQARLTGVTSHERLAGDPPWHFEFHHVSPNGEGTLLTVVRRQEDGKWQTRIVAVDTNGIEHTESSVLATPAESTRTWTYTFLVPPESILAFRAQVRPLHWVEFPDLALQPDPSPRVQTAPERRTIPVSKYEVGSRVGRDRRGSDSPKIGKFSDGQSASMPPRLKPGHHALSMAGPTFHRFFRES